MAEGEATVSEAPVTRRDRSVARVIDPARQRAEQRVQKFLDAALELMLVGDRDFTLQEVVERSGLSLRSFYQHFGGKHELLLALFEDSVRRSAELLRAQLEGVDDPLERLHVLVVEYYVLNATGHRGRAVKDAARVPAMSQFAQGLLSEHPMEASGAFSPVRELFEEVLGAAVEAGVVRPAPRLRRRASFLFQTINFNAFVTSSLDAARNRREERAAGEELWDLLHSGLRPD